MSVHEGFWRQQDFCQSMKASGVNKIYVSPRRFQSIMLLASTTYVSVHEGFWHQQHLCQSMKALGVNKICVSPWRFLASIKFMSVHEGFCVSPWKLLASVRCMSVHEGLWRQQDSSQSMKDSGVNKIHVSPWMLLASTRFTSVRKGSLRQQDLCQSMKASGADTQRKIIALDRQGTQQQRPESPTVTPPGMQAITRCTNSTKGTVWRQQSLRHEVLEGIWFQHELVKCYTWKLASNRLR